MPCSCGTYRTLFGGLNARIDSIFAGTGLIPSCARRYPRYSTSVAQKEYLSALHFSPACLKSWRILPSLLKYSSKDSFVSTRRSSKSVGAVRGGRGYYSPSMLGWSPLILIFLPPKYQNIPNFILK